MYRSFVSSLVTLRRRSTFVLLGLMGLLGALSTTLATSSVGDPERFGPPGAGGSISTAGAEAAGGWGHLVGQSGQLIGVVALCIAAAAVAGEYSLGTWRNLAVRQPNRLRLMGGKLAAVAVVIAVGVLIAVLCAAPAVLVAAQGKGLETTEWFTVSGVAGLGSALANLVISGLGYAAIGVALGVAFRSPTPAIGAGVAWLLPLETLSRLALGDAGRWLPGQILSSVGSGGSSTMAYSVALAASVVIGVICVVGSVGRFARQELG